MNKNIMTINNNDIGISKIEFDKNGNLIITDKSSKYSLVVCIKYNIGDINNVKIGESKSINFDEYYISENNESALIKPIVSLVEKEDDNILCFTFEFDNLDNKLCYMNKRKHFDIELHSLKCKIYINCNDEIDDIIIYRY